MAAQQPTQRPPWLDMAQDPNNLVFNPQSMGFNPGSLEAVQPTQRGMNVANQMQPLAAQMQQPLQPPMQQQQPMQQGMPGQSILGDPQRVISELVANRNLARDQQSRGIKETEELLKSHLENSKKGQLDLSPILALTDAWTGSRLAQSYQKPTDSKAYLETTAALQNLLQKSRGALTDDEQQFLLTQLGILKQEELGKLKLDAAKESSLASAANREISRNQADEKINIGANSDFDKRIGEPMLMRGELVSGITDIKNILAETGGKIPAPNDPKYADYMSAVSRVTVNFNRDIAKLGALAGADLSLLEKATATSPSAVSTFFQEKLRGGTGGLTSVLDSIERGADRMTEQDATRTRDIWGKRTEKAYENARKSYYEKKKGTYTPSSQAQFAPQNLTREQKIKLLQERAAKGGN